MKKFNITNYKYELLFVLLFVSPVIIFGNNDIEEYMLGFFSSKIYWSNFSSLFTVFYDFYGPGTKMPLGHGPLYHPLNVFLFNLKVYYFLFITLHLIIQIEFTKKLFKHFGINYSNPILLIIIIFCLPNLLNAISDDWISEFFSYCFFPLIFYYVVKIIKNQKKIDYLKFTLFFSFWIINGHIGVISLYIIFLALFFLFSLKDFYHVKQNLNKLFLISILLILLILSEHLFFLIREGLNFESEKAFQVSYSKRPYFEILFPLSLSWWPLNRLPGNPIIIYFSLFICALTLFHKIKGFLKDKKKIIIFNKENNFKFCLLFMIFFILSLTDILKYTGVVSGAWWSRDILIYLGMFIYFINYKNFNKTITNILNILIIFYSFLFFFINVYDLQKKNDNNFILNKFNDTDFIKKLTEIDLKKNDYKRIYLSPELFPGIFTDFKQDGIFSQTDLIKFNLAPFNGYFKNTSMNDIYPDKSRMHGYIGSDFKYINNEFFLDIFKINYLLISEQELKFLENEKFLKIKEIQTNKKKLFIFERKVSKYALDEKSMSELNLNLQKCNVSKLDCILKSEKFFKKSNYKMTRISNSKFNINSTVDEKNNYLILPFLADKNWQSKNYEIKYVHNFLMGLKPLNENETIVYFDKYRFILRILSLTSLIVLIIYILSFKKIRFNKI